MTARPSGPPDYRVSDRGDSRGPLWTTVVNPRRTGVETHGLPSTLGPRTFYSKAKGSRGDGSEGKVRSSLGNWSWMRHGIGVGQTWGSGGGRGVPTKKKTDGVRSRSVCVCFTSSSRRWGTSTHLSFSRRVRSSQCLQVRHYSNPKGRQNDPPCNFVVGTGRPSSHPPNSSTEDDDGNEDETDQGVPSVSPEPFS